MQKTSVMSSEVDGVGMQDNQPPPPMAVDESVQMNHVGEDDELQRDMSAPMTSGWSWIANTRERPHSRSARAAMDK